MSNTHAGLFSGCPVVKCGAVAHSSSADGDEGNSMADLGGIGSNGKWNWRVLQRIKSCKIFSIVHKSGLF